MVKSLSIIVKRFKDKLFLTLGVWRPDCSKIKRKGFGRLCMFVYLTVTCKNSTADLG